VVLGLFLVKRLLFDGWQAARGAARDGLLGMLAPTGVSYNPEDFLVEDKKEWWQAAENFSTDAEAAHDQQAAARWEKIVAAAFDAGAHSVDPPGIRTASMDFVNNGIRMKRSVAAGVVAP
jgi:hypothetical protein